MLDNTTPASCHVRLARESTVRDKSGVGIKGVQCDTPAQGLIGLIGYSYQQIVTSFSEAGLQRTQRLSVLGPEQFGDG